MGIATPLSSGYSSMRARVCESCPSPHPGLRSFPNLLFLGPLPLSFLFRGAQWSSPFCPFQVTLNNHIPEKPQPGIRVPSEPKELEENEVIPKRVPSEAGNDISNKVSMSSTAQDSNIFERTEVLAGKAPSFSQVFEEGSRPESL